LVDRILGVVATSNRDWINAKKHLDDAMTIARREGLRPEHGHILVAQADLELAQGGLGSAVHVRARLAQALAIFREIGCDTGDIRRKLHNLPPQPSTPFGKPLPAGLSPREVEVLRLVTMGKSNHQIAQELALSENTVAKHLTSIFNKTGCDNRAAAVAFAIRHEVA
jgi:DNA-binding NarL/FixJ family response regulator